MKNWAGNIEFHDSKTISPRSVEELSNVIKESTSVKARGSRHSFNAIADTHGVGIDLSRMPREISLNEEERFVRITADTKYGEVASFLQSRGWALANMASLPHISVVGACATGTHGSGRKNGGLHTSVRAIELIDGLGNLRRITNKEESFYGAVVNLGLLGVVTHFELEIEPTYEISQVVFPDFPIRDYQSNLDAIMSSAYSVSFFSNWNSDLTGEIWSKSRTLENSVPGFPSAKPATRKYHPVPGVDPSVTTDQLGVPGPWSDRLSHFKMEFTPSVGSEIQSEFFVSVSDAQAVIDILIEMQPRIHPHLFVNEIRAIAADQHWMSPFYSRDSIAFHFTWKPDLEIYPLIQEIEDKLVRFSYRPHMAKVFHASPSYLKKQYPKWDEFMNLRTEFDPAGKFLNSYSQRYLQTG